MKQKELREKMPQIADLIDQLCAAFGQKEIHGQVRKGLKGEPVFWASENGYEIGTHVYREATTKGDTNGA